MNQTVNISFEKALLKEIDKIAKKEHRSRSELIREAARSYIEKKAKWADIFALGENIAKNAKISQDDVFDEIRITRKNLKAS
ncbi:CopG family ribbon-helix-helix protein [Leptospira idonii]|uniref:Ribbon-helix-helix protein, CopG family n=1 Tax=Leptospira idonii TaxID=1193500 RepID=A0A4R9M1H0_9LEPT|nr:ribbon-helix-helix domain-containing protein [Leptospira idonii]TGN19675.1 ribbon-helix-helix protein, CopG family [Leptospira idonii]